MFRRTVLFVLFIFILIGCEQNTESKEILFVCTHGAARSPIAAAHFNKLAKEKDLNFHAVFRGTEPNEVLTKETLKGLTTDGFDVNDWLPKKVSTEDIEQAYKIVTFDCAVQSNKDSSLKEEWNGTPSISKDYNVARNVINGHVERLIENIENN